MSPSAPIQPGRASTIKPNRRKLRENIQSITRPSIRRLARRGGVVRIKKEIYGEVRGIIMEQLSKVLHNIVLVVESSQTHKYDRKMVTTRDIVFALNRMGSTVYGFSGV